MLKTYLGKPVFTNLESHKETLENEIFFLTKAITGKYIQVRCHYTRAEGILTTWFIESYVKVDNNIQN